jgi:hypothetical protein
VIEHASTGDVVVVPLGIADRVRIHGLDRAARYQDWTEPGDFAAVTWGVK